MKYKLKRHKDFRFDLKKASLLVIDVQDYFTKKGSHAFIPSSTKIIPNINSLIDKFHKANRPIIFTRHIDVEKNNMMSRWWQDRIEKDNPLSQINKEIDTTKGKIIVKHRYDAFMGTNLEKFLRSKGTEQVVVTGVVAHICCETTARAAFMRDFVTWIVTDGVASYNKKHYEAALFNLSHAFAIPTETKELL
jgi:bifunctional isochorismate lyase/aryl carrier protein